MTIKYNNVPESDPLDNEQDYHDNHPDNPKNKMSKETELVIYDQNKFVEIFTKKTGDSFIEKLEKEVADFQKTSDISSEEGQKAIRSYSYELSQHKAPLKKAKLQITEEVRSTITALNSEENRLLDRIQELQDEVRQPLTDFENKEKERIEVRRNRINEMGQFVPASWDHSSTFDIKKKLDELIIFDWQEFEFKAKNIYKTQIDSCDKRIEELEEIEKQEVELEKLRKEKEEREKKDREDQIIRETEEDIRRVEREKADKVAKEVEEQRYRLEAEKKAAEQAKINAEIRVKQAALTAKAEREQTQIQAKKDQEEAIRLERARAEAVRQKQIDEEKAREADLEHRTKINNEAADVLAQVIQKELLEVGQMTDATALMYAKKVLKAIVNGRVPHVLIKY